MVGRPSTREPSAFGKRLAALREEKGITQAELAARLKVSQQLVAYYERRAPSPTLDFVEAAAGALGVSVVALLGHEKAERRSRPGPASAFEQRLERLRKLPKKQQTMILKMIDAALDAAA
jgi:transcriptional regulator with XRE-family HTH domain